MRFYLLLILFFAINSSAQTAPIFQRNYAILESPFKPHDSLQIASLNSLAKLNLSQVAAIDLSTFDINRALNRQNAARRYATMYIAQDANGRDIPIPMIERLTTELYYKNIPQNFNANCKY